jgi:hypothetical protein
VLRVRGNLLVTIRVLLRFCDIESVRHQEKRHLTLAETSGDNGTIQEMSKIQD